MPLYLIRCYATMLNQLQAEHDLRLIVTGRVAGSGQLKPAAARQVVDNLRRDANADSKRPANIHRLRSAGIRVERRKG